MISHVNLAAFLQVILIDIILCYPLIFGLSVIFIWIPRAQIRKVIYFSFLSIVVAKFVLAGSVGVLSSVVGFMLLMSLATLVVAWLQIRRLVVRSPAQKQISARRGVIEISVAGVGMSFVPVLALAGASHDHVLATLLGVPVSTAIMILAGYLLGLLHNRVRWTAWIAALFFMLFALRDVYEGINEIVGYSLPQFP